MIHSPDHLVLYPYTLQNVLCLKGPFSMQKWVLGERDFSHTKHILFNSYNKRGYLGIIMLKLRETKYFLTQLID